MPCQYVLAEARCQFLRVLGVNPAAEVGGVQFTSDFSPQKGKSGWGLF